MDKQQKIQGKEKANSYFAWTASDRITTVYIFHHGKQKICANEIRYTSNTLRLLRNASFGPKITLKVIVFKVVQAFFLTGDGVYKLNPSLEALTKSEQDKNVVKI